MRRSGGGADEIGRRRFHERRAQTLLPVADAARELAFHVVDELVDLELHRFNLAAHVENDLDSRQVDAEVAGERENRLELFEVLFGIQAGIALGAGRLQQSLALVQAQRLRVDVVLLRHRADHVVRLA